MLDSAPLSSWMTHQKECVSTVVGVEGNIVVQNFPIKYMQVCRDLIEFTRKRRIHERIRLVLVETDVYSVSRFSLRIAEQAPKNTQAHTTREMTYMQKKEHKIN